MGSEGAAGRRRRWGTVLTLLLAAGCGVEATDDRSVLAGPSPTTRAEPTGPSAEPVPWSTVVDLATAPIGRYTKETWFEPTRRDGPLMRQWVEYDDRVDVLDARVALSTQVDPDLEHGSRDRPHLRFVRRGDDVLMWNPNEDLVAACGGPWVRMPIEAIADAVGLESVEFEGSEVAMMVDALGGPATVAATDRRETTYDATVDGGVGLSSAQVLALDDATRTELLALRNPATFAVTTEGDVLEVTVDASTSLVIAGDLEPRDVPPGSMTVVWRLELLDELPLSDVPATAPDASCAGAL